MIKASGSQIFNLWNVANLSVFFAIWYAKNQRQLNNILNPLAHFLAFIWASMKEAN